MCGIAGLLQLNLESVSELSESLKTMNHLQIHRGPDGDGIWLHPNEHIGFAHRRLSIIDIETGAQPMSDNRGNWVTYNGEIYNYPELKTELGINNFKTHSDTEVILLAYQKWGIDCINHFRGMFAFALWDEEKQALFCARDRFGIKPFYYTIVDNVFYFSSEVKALLPFIKKIETNPEGLQDYITFQFYLNGKTLFNNIHELSSANFLYIKNGQINKENYWQVYYSPDFDHTEKYFFEQIESLIQESVHLHLRSDVPIGAYVSGGIDSSIIAAMAAKKNQGMQAFTGKFSYSQEYDESAYARELAKKSDLNLFEIDIQASDFLSHIQKIIYHLDYPIAGPGAFPQFMVSKLVQSQNCKTVLGGQGGDEIFGGYARYLIAYFEQCIKAAIDGTMDNGNFIVTYESILPNLVTLKNYKPLIKEFWSQGLFEDLDKRYFRLINRSNSFNQEIQLSSNSDYSSYKSFQSLFTAKNVQKQSYFDSMTHFDFKTLLPALLHIEDRVSMAHGVESRVPFLDHFLIEKAATIPSNIKFKNGSMKYVLKNAMKHYLPQAILDRKDKMGFPVPLNEWLQGELRDFVIDIFSSQQARQRDYIDAKQVLKNLEKEPKFSRKIWGLLCLELWYQTFQDKHHEFIKLKGKI
ncbi:MAG: asparagine synthase (glutamine-hydrolyzing) [Candidatus Sericytochromatia bacterium]